MQLLPSLAGRPGGYLPFSDAAAVRLMAGLLADPSQRARPCATALRNDPPLAVWAACLASRHGRDGFRTTDDLGEWFAQAGLPLLHTLDWAEAEEIRSQDSEHAELAAQWAARSIALAKLAADIAKQQGLCCDSAYFLALIHEAPRWLNMFGDSHASAKALLPSWLAEKIREINAKDLEGGCDTPAHCAAVALTLATSESQPGLASAFHFDPAAHAARENAARQAWLQSNEAAGQLRNLTEKLARLADLESGFQSALEFEKLESLKELAYGASHEINNPLANISARAQTLLREERDPERRRRLASINSQAFRAHEMISDMMLFARPPRLKPEETEISGLVQNVVRQFDSIAGDQDTTLVFHAAPLPISARIDKTQIAVAVRALCANALEALVTGGRVEVSVAISRHAVSSTTMPVGLTHPPISSQLPRPDESAKSTSHVQITVSDDGPGIRDEVRRHIFDPFYSGREAGRGIGFGLSKCWRIVTMHGGSIEVESSHGRGSRFVISLPLAK